MGVMAMSDAGGRGSRNEDAAKRKSAQQWAGQRTAEVSSDTKSSARTPRRQRIRGAATAG